MDLTPSASKKMKFVPKAPGRRPPKPVVPKTEVVDDAESFEAKELMRRFNDGLSARKPKYEKKSAPVRVAFGHGSSTTQNSYYNDSKPNATSYSDYKLRKEYKEPWDYDGYYPATLPLRRPYSGNPNALDEEEFGTLFESTDKKRMSTTAELGLMDEFSEPRLMLFQLPRTVPLPVIKQDDASSSNQPNPGPSVNKCGLLKDLPEGLMGKLLVYNSGKVKLKLGDALYDVNPGSDCKFAEDAVAMNTNEKHCSILGQIHKHAVVTPDVDSILDNITDQGVDSILDNFSNADLG